MDSDGSENAKTRSPDQHEENHLQDRMDWPKGLVQCERYPPRIILQILLPKSYDALRPRLELPVSTISSTGARWSAFDIVYDELTTLHSILRLTASYFYHKTRLQLTCFSRTFSSPIK